ncbi:hypothetical protein QJS04_geneDACA019216 [Acorus gramineus]|uniref:Uncharacterized protein n=1 Tax=Acorus gramineus TaxID=55184 RepID=A0AAV8ZXD5_ACOGR|nr:hypothetical protein QJS04_geneDACA019216 [Acorus gramineus]
MPEFPDPQKDYFYSSPTDDSSFWRRICNPILSILQSVVPVGASVKLKLRHPMDPINIISIDSDDETEVGSLEDMLPVVNGGSYNSGGEIEFRNSGIDTPFAVTSISSDSDDVMEMAHSMGAASSSGQFPSANTRKLPSWGSTPLNAGGSGGSLPDPTTGSPTNRLHYVTTDNWMGPSEQGMGYRDHQLQAKFRKLPASMDDQTLAKKLYPNVLHREHITSANSRNNAQTVQARNASPSQPNNNWEASSKLPYQNTEKRTLPGSTQQSLDKIASKTSPLKSHFSIGETSGTQKDYMNGDLGRENKGAFIHENDGTRRQLPSSFMRGKSIPTQPGGTYENGNHTGAGDGHPLDTDERHILQAALQDISQPRAEADLPDGLLAVPLLRHQKIALAWMLQKETTSLHCLGGILGDDQGLGKTISTIALIQMQMPLQTRFKSDNLRQNKIPETLNLDEEENDRIDLDKTNQIAKDEVSERTPSTSSSTSTHMGRPAAGTLIVCPASILRQWAREIDEKVPHGARLDVLFYHGGSRTKNPVELAKYDVVLTTYAIVTNEVPKQSLVDDDDGEQRNNRKYGLSSDFSTDKKRKNTSNAGKKGKKKGKEINGSNLDFGSGPLAKVRWFRVVLDEAQTIKNHRTQVARACSALRAKRRWCLSGTPIQNAIDDLYSYFRYLKYDPYSGYKSFCCTIKHPISRNASTGYKKLQAVLKTVMLRRTKGTLIDGKPIVDLPPKSICLKKVDFSQEERDFYARLEADSRKQFKAYAAAGTVKQNYANILLLLLRLRQACDHPLLVKGYHSDSVRQTSLDAARKIPRETLIHLLNLLEASLAICGVCSDPPEDAVVTMCGHVFCYQCVSEHITGDDNICPAPRCKHQLRPDSVFSRSALKSCISDHHGYDAGSSRGIEEEIAIQQSACTSSKVRATLEILNSLYKYKDLASEPGSDGYREMDYFKERTYDGSSLGSFSNVGDRKQTDASMNMEPEPPVKVIIFSQWTSMLDLLETSLNYNLIQYRRLDGTMSLASRDRAVKDFTNDPEVVVMIMSLKAGNLGLNLVAASYVILLDLWWNPTTEDQAIDRAHRIGQTRPVTVFRMTIKDTVEDRILALQEEKRMMVSSAFGEDKAGNIATRLTMEDLRYLFMV